MNGSTHKINYEAASKRDYVREHGGEPALRDVDDLTPEEKRAKRAPLKRAEKEALAELTESLNDLKRKWDRLEIPERDRIWVQQKQEIQKVTRLARARLDSDSRARLDERFDELSDAAIDHLGAPPRSPQRQRRRQGKQLRLR